MFMNMNVHDKFCSAAVWSEDPLNTHPVTYFILFDAMSLTIITDAVSDNEFLRDFVQ